MTLRTVGGLLSSRAFHLLSQCRSVNNVKVDFLLFRNFVAISPHFSASNSGLHCSCLSRTTQLPHKFPFEHVIISRAAVCSRPCGSTSRDASCNKRYFHSGSAVYYAKKRGNRFNKPTRTAGDDDDDDYSTDDDDDDDESDDDSVGDGVPKDYKSMLIQAKNFRLDHLLHKALKLSSKNVEKQLYANKIRVNGHPPKKKSQSIYEGDVYDWWVDTSKENPNFDVVNRVKVVKIVAKDIRDTVPVEVHRWTNLLVDDWKSSQSNN